MAITMSAWTANTTAVKLQCTPLVDGGHGAIGGRGQAVFGTCLADGKRARWERYDVLGVIKPEKMPDWAKEAVAEIKKQEKAKKPHSKEER